MEEKKNILDHLQPKRIETPTDDFFRDMASGIVAGTSKKRNSARIIYLAVAAAAILILSLVFIVPTGDSIQKDAADVTFADLDEKEIEEYMEAEHVEDLTAHLSQGLLTDTIKKPVKGMSAEKLEKAFSELSEEEILQFFQEQGLDPEEEEEEEILIF